METLLQFKDYRAYLRHTFDEAGKRSGAKKKAAAALEVHTTFISQVLGEQCSLSPEQADRMNAHLGHSEDEADYFLTLVLRDRAGSPSLRRRYDKQLLQIRERSQQVHRKLEKTSLVLEENQRQFYSTYLHSAIHVLVSIEKYNSVEALSSALGLPRSRIHEAVHFMLSIGVIQNQGGHLSPGKAHIHLPPDSKYLGQHHLNWRLQMIDRLLQAKPDEIHYSAVISLSHADVEKIKESLLNNLRENSKTIMASPEETAYVYCFDFFKLAVD